MSDGAKASALPAHAKTAKAPSDLVSDGAKACALPTHAKTAEAPSDLVSDGAKACALPAHAKRSRGPLRPRVGRSQGFSCTLTASCGTQSRSTECEGIARNAKAFRSASMCDVTRRHDKPCASPSQAPPQRSGCPPRSPLAGRRRERYNADRSDASPVIKEAALIRPALPWGTRCRRAVDSSSNARGAPVERSPLWLKRRW